MILIDFKFEGFCWVKQLVGCCFFGVVCEKSSRLGSSNLKCRKWSKMSNLKRGDFRKEMYNYVYIYIYIFIYSYSIYIYIYIYHLPTTMISKVYIYIYIYKFKKFSQYSRIIQETPAPTKTTSLPRRCSSRCGVVLWSCLNLPEFRVCVDT